MQWCKIENHSILIGVFRIIINCVYELRQLVNYNIKEEDVLLGLLEEMIHIISGSEVPFIGSVLIERKFLLLCYSFFLGAGTVLQKYNNKISNAPFFNGRSKEDSAIFLTIWKGAIHSDESDFIEWHMPALELWYDLQSCHKILTKHWPLIIDIVALKPFNFVQSLPEIKYQSIDKRLENAKHLFLLHLILFLSCQWDTYGQEYNNETSLFASISATRIGSRFRRLIIIFKFCDISGYLVIASGRVKSDNYKNLSIPPTLNELEQRESRFLFIQRVTPIKKNPSTVDISHSDFSIPSIDIDVLSNDKYTGLDVWFITDHFGADHYFITP